MYSFQHSAAIRALAGAAALAVLGAAGFQTLRLSFGSHPALEDALNPTDWQAWIRSGTRAEAAGDFPRAEHDYLQAAAVNRQFQPAWTLANYFFRRDRRPEFELWAGRALRMSYGDRRPLFDLCWRADPSPSLVFRNGGERPDLLRLYLAYLTAEGRLVAAGDAARQLLAHASPNDLPELTAYCGRVLESGTPIGALEVWNELCRRRLLPHAPLDPEHGQSLTNGDFAAPPSSLGFDWRIVPWTGVTVVPIADPPVLRIAFSGEEPESCELLTQLVPVKPGRSYRLAYEFRTPGTAPATGLRWRVYGVPDNRELSEAPPQLTGEDWTRQEIRFAVSQYRLARLVLEYRKAPDAARLEGSLWLRQIRLD